MDYYNRLLSTNYGLLWGIVAYYLGLWLLGFPGSYRTGKESSQQRPSAPAAPSPEPKKDLARALELIGP